MKRKSKTKTEAKLRRALRAARELLLLGDPDGLRAMHIFAPEDRLIGELCEKIGYGAVMDSAARQWRRIDSYGAHTTGAAAGCIEKVVKEIDEALK